MHFKDTEAYKYGLHHKFSDKEVPDSPPNINKARKLEAKRLSAKNSKRKLVGQCSIDDREIDYRPKTITQLFDVSTDLFQLEQPKAACRCSSLGTRQHKAAEEEKPKG